METGSQPWRTERVGFGALSGAAVSKDSRPKDAVARAARAELEALPAGDSVEEPGGEVQEQNVDDSADNISHSTESRVGYLGPTLSKISTP